MRRAHQKRGKKASNKLISFVIVTVVIFLGVLCGSKGKEIQAQNTTAEDQIQALQEQIESEEARTDELEEYSKYVNTKQFVEDMARAKLGLIYPDEIIFKAEE